MRINFTHLGDWLLGKPKPESETVRTLRAARALIEDPKHWTQRAYARTASGDFCDADSSDAVCWCARGALAAVGADWPALEAMGVAAGEMGVTGTNDRLGHKAVLSLFDVAIAEERARV